MLRPYSLKVGFIALIGALLCSGMALADPIHDAAATGDIGKLSKLIKKGADVNTRKTDNFDNAPLHIAADRGNTEAVKLLIEMGADVNAKNIYNVTPMHYAAYAGHTETTSLLLERGADITARNIHGATPLHLAAEASRTDTINLLISRGADINVTNNYGATPLHSAADTGAPDSAALLINHGADIYAKANNGETALNMAYQGFVGLRIKSEGNFITVDAVVADSPAQSAGLQPGDRILVIGSESASGMTVQDAVKRLRGKAGTQVSFMVQKAGSGQTVSHAITRRVLKNKEAVARLIEARIARDWEASMATGTETTYRDFISRCPESLYRTEAVKALAGLYLARPDADKALETALSEYPDMIVFLPTDKQLRFTGPPDMQVYKILDHLRKGMGEKLIITKIRSEKGGYKNFTLDEMLKLKEMGLPEPVIDEMIAATARAQAATENAAMREEIAQLRKTIEEMQAQQQAMRAQQAPAPGQPVQASIPQQPGVGEAIANCASQLAALELCNQAPGGFIGQEICKAAAKSQFPCNR